MKKILAFFAALIMCVTLFAACGNGGGGGGGTKKDPFLNLPTRVGEEVRVGVLLNSVDSNTEVVKNYLNNEIGPALKMKFDFSAKINTDDELVTFIETEKTMGAVGIINLCSSSAHIVVNECQKYGLYCQQQKSAFAKESRTVSATLGNCGASSTGMEEAYKVAVNEILADGANHSAVIYSCAATKKSAESHYYSALAVLNAMKDKYGLDYGETPEAIAESAYVKELTTGNSNVKINFVSGMIEDSVKTPLKTGKYDIFACVAGFEQYTQTINDVEKSMGNDIKVIATASIDDTTKIGFEKGDLDYAVINPLTIAYAINAVSIRNAVDGYASLYKDAEGNAVQLNVTPWLCRNADDYAGIAKLDKAGTWVISGDEAKQLCKSNNAEVTTETLVSFLEELGDLEQLLAKKIK